jgi:hypothetical protein
LSENRRALAHASRREGNPPMCVSTTAHF